MRAGRLLPAIALPVLGLVVVNQLVGSAPSGASSVIPGERQTPLEHIVIIHKENRSFDHYFGTFPGANGATRGEMSDGTEIDLVQALDPMPQDIGHNTDDWPLAYNGGEMNGFDLQRDAFTPEGYPVAYSQMDEAQIPNYWAYARRYGLGDNYFHDFQGASFANNLFRFAAQTGREDPALGQRAAYSLPSAIYRPTSDRWGCDNSADALVEMMAPTDELTNAFPCFGFRALPNILAENGVSWHLYADEKDRSFVLNSLVAIAKVRYDPELWANLVPFSSFVTDALSGDLPAVSWVQSIDHEHPMTSTVCDGENEVVEMVDAVMNGPLWNSTAILITYDEWGGFYDHVAPPVVDNLSYGFRAPVLVISPWVKYGDGSDGGYISSEFYSHASPLKLVEINWNLPSLNSRDAGANGLTDFFDFQQTPKGPLILSERSCPEVSPELMRLRASVPIEDSD
jgi:phospholipase C